MATMINHAKSRYLRGVIYGGVYMHILNGWEYFLHFIFPLHFQLQRYVRIFGYQTLKLYYNYNHFFKKQY